MTRAGFFAVRLADRYVIVPLASIVRLEARDERVTVVADRHYPHRDTLAAMCDRLPSEDFVRVHRSHVVRIAAVTEVRPLGHGEFELRMRDGSAITTGRSYRECVELRLGLRSTSAQTSREAAAA